MIFFFSSVSGVHWQPRAMFHLRASLKTFLILSFGEELKVRLKQKLPFLEMPLKSQYFLHAENAFFALDKFRCQYRAGSKTLAVMRSVNDLDIIYLGTIFYFVRTRRRVYSFANDR